jgi:hypothetical protein
MERQVAQTDAFWTRGISKIKVLPSVAGSSPTRNEITAGVDLTPYIAAPSGFTLKNSPIDRPDLSDGFNGQIDGPDSVDDSSLMCYDGSTSSVARSTCPKGTTVYLVLFRYGDTVGKRCEVWPCRVTGTNDDWAGAMDTKAAQVNVSFAVLSRPNQNATVPA